MATRMTTGLIDSDLRRNPSISPQVISYIITARQRSCGKVMFSVMSVCQSFCSQDGGRRSCPNAHCMGPWPIPTLVQGQGQGPARPDMFKLVRHRHTETTGTLPPPTCSNLFTLKHRLSSSGQWAFDLNGFLFKNIFKLLLFKPIYRRRKGWGFGLMSRGVYWEILFAFPFAFELVRRHHGRFLGLTSRGRYGREVQCIMGNDNMGLPRPFPVNRQTDTSENITFL